MSLTMDRPWTRYPCMKRPSKPEQEHSDWLSSRITAFDYAKDARLEAMACPNRKILYRKHVDIDKRYERKARYYKICRNWCNTNRNREIRATEEKFTKLLQHTLESTQTKTPVLVSKYNKWKTRSAEQDEFENVFDDQLRELESSNSIAKAFKDASTPMLGNESRMSGVRSECRSRSLSALPAVNKVVLPVNIGRRQSERATLRLPKAATSLAIPIQRRGLR